MSSPARVGRRAGGAVAGAAYTFFVTMVGTTLPTPLYGLYRSELGFSRLVQTTVFATYAVGVITALVLAGQASDRFGRRPVLLVGLLAAAASAAVFCAPVTLTGLFAGRFLSGVSAGLFTGTATTALVELAPRARARAAGLVATAANILGLGTGPLLAAVLAVLATGSAPPLSSAVPLWSWVHGVAQALGPLRLPYLVHLALLVPAAVLTLAQPETVGGPDGQLHRPPWRVLRPGVPAEVRAAFWPAAASSFAGFATLGLFTAVEPAVLSTLLGVDGLVAAGAVVTLVFTSSVVAQAGTVAAPAARALPAGCGVLVAGMAALVVALQERALPLFLLACVLLGAGQGVCFRAGIAGVSAAAPPRRRGEVLSTLFVVLYVGISLPVIGVGALSQVAGLTTATTVFACFVALLAAAGGAVSLRRGLG